MVTKTPLHSANDLPHRDYSAAASVYLGYHFPCKIVATPAVHVVDESFTGAVVSLLGVRLVLSILEYAVSPAEVAQAARGMAGYLGVIATAGKNMPAARAAAAQSSRGQPNAKTGAGHLKNPDAVRLGEEIGLSVMGPMRDTLPRHQKQC